MGRTQHPRTVFLPVAGGKWSATMQTPAGPVTAVADSAGEAQHALDELLVIARALEVTREGVQARTIAARTRNVVHPPSGARRD